MPRSKVGSSNGGVIGKTNKTSFGLNKTSTKSASTPSAVTTQPGTNLIKVLIGAGGRVVCCNVGGVGCAGTVNTGGGGGGPNNGPYPVSSASGGSGIVIIRYKFQ